MAILTSYQAKMKKAVIDEPNNLTSLYCAVEEKLGRKPTKEEIEIAVFGYQFRGGLSKRKRKLQKVIREL